MREPAGELEIETSCPDSILNMVITNQEGEEVTKIYLSFIIVTCSFTVIFP